MIYKKKALIARFLPPLDHDAYAYAKRCDTDECGDGRHVFVHLRKTRYAQKIVVIGVITADFVVVENFQRHFICGNETGEIFFHYYHFFSILFFLDTRRFRKFPQYFRFPLSFTPSLKPIVNSVPAQMPMQSVQSHTGPSFPQRLGYTDKKKKN